MFQRSKRGGWPYSQPLNVPFEVNWDSPQAKGLMAWWPMIGGQGGWPVRDVATGRFSMVPINSPVWVADGERGWSMLFDDAANESLAALIPTLSEPFSLTAWFNCDVDNSANAVLSIGDADGLDYHGIWARGDIANDPVGATSWDGAAGATATIVGFTVDTWHHLAGIYAAANSRRAIFDGFQTAQENTNIVVAGADRCMVGASADSTPFGYMSGMVQDCRIYDRALADQEVLNMYLNPWELYRPLVRRLWVLAPAAPPAGAMPMAMDHYRRRRV